jgi:hypothetical protein
VPVGGLTWVSCGLVLAGRASWSRPHPVPGTPRSHRPAWPTLGAQVWREPGSLERVALPALRTPRIGGVVVVDELDRIELASTASCEALTALLGRDVAVVATVHQSHHRLTDALKRRPEIGMVRVTETTPSYGIEHQALGGLPLASL